MYDKIFEIFKEGNTKEALNLALEIYNNNKKNDRACRMLGEIYLKIKNFEKSEFFFKKAIKINPKKEYFFSIGYFYLKKKEYQKSIYNFKKYKIDGFYNEITLNNISFCYFKIGEYKQAINLLLKAISINKKNHFFIYNLANAYKEIDELDKAIFYYDEALKLNPNNKNYLFNKSLVLLKKRNYKKGWELYDLRVELKNNKNEIYNLIKENIYSQSSLPKDPRSKLCIMAEQGVGDQLLFSSMYDDLLKKYKNVFIFSDKRLVNTFQKTFNYKNFIENENVSEIKFLLSNNYKFIYAASLAKFYRNKKKDFDKYKRLYVDSDIKKNISKKLQKNNTDKLIGISWHSETKSLYSKSMNIQMFKKMSENKNLKLINLQYGKAAGEIKKYRMKIINIRGVDIYNDFESLIALIDSLDFVVTIDNINAQIAGLLRKKTFVITPFNNEYMLYSRSNLGKCDWYPNTKIFYTNLKKTNINNQIKKIIKLI